MKTQFHSPFVIRHSSFNGVGAMFLAALTLLATSRPAFAQADSVTVSAAEFQRLVYSSHLRTQLDEKPELEAGLVTLLELQRRNPHADPAALGDVLRQALVRYRAGAPTRFLPTPRRDEILAAYLEMFHQVPGRTNFNPAAMSLIHGLITRAQSPTGRPQADLIHSGSQALLGAESGAAQSEALVETCTRRAAANRVFREAMDSLLLPEIGAGLTQTPAAILGANSALSNSPTMQELLRLSAASGDGSVTISTNTLKNLFVSEMQLLHDIINTNLAVHLEILDSQTDLSSYLTNTALIQANLQWETAAKEGQAQRIAAAGAAVNTLGTLVTDKLPVYGQAMKNIGEGVKGLAQGVHAWSEAAKLAKVAACGNFVGAGMQLVGTLLGFFGVFQDPNDVIVKEIGQVKTLIGNLSTNMNYRFDRVDQSLSQVLDQLSYSIDLIGEVGHDVNQVRQGLLDVQTDLCRLERNLATFHALDWRYNLIEYMNLGLGYEARVGSPMAYDLYTPNYVGMENIFYTHAYNRATSETLSRCDTLPFTDADLSHQLSAGGATNAYAEVLNYVKKCLRVKLGLPGFDASPILANPQDWNAGAGAWLELAVENPLHFRRYAGAAGRLDNVIGNGRAITNFIRNLVFTGGANINWSLHNALLTNYSARLNSFVSQVHSTEQGYASLNHFALDTWRDWSAAAPRLTAANTEVQASDPRVPLVSPPAQVHQIAAGITHNLALKTDGSVIGWGLNDHGQTTIPASATNVIAVAAGAVHSLALRSNGTAVAWGAGTNDPGVVPEVGQCIVPSHATNLIAISAGAYHSLALRTDGKVMGWGYGVYGQTTTPLEATNVVAIVAGGLHSLALRGDGTVVGWGLNHLGQTTIPEDATNVVALAAGYDHSLALRGDGTLVAWGDNANGQTTIPYSATNVVAIAAGGNHCLALKADGTVVGWGQNQYGQSNIPPSAIRVRELAAGLWHSLALRADGSVVAWGAKFYELCSVPALPTWQKAISAGGWVHVLGLRPDGRVLAWGDNSYGQIETPANLTNAVAVAAGRGGFSLALRADGTVLGWGRNNNGQTTIPASATNVIAIAAGGGHGLAARTDGTVVAWGDNSQGQRTVPASATNVIAVAAGNLHSLALRADGTVVGWGYNAYGQRTIPPSASSNVVALAAGMNFSLALKTDGTVVAWSSYSGAGQTNTPADATNVVAIVADGDHSLALRADGTVVGWGYNNYGQSTVPDGLDNVVAIAGSFYGSLAVKADGSVVAWGDTSRWDWGQGQTDLPAVPPPMPVDATTNRFQATHWGATPVPTDTPLPGYALSFDGINDYVRIEDSSALDLTVNYTLECWFKASGFGGLRGLISKYHTPAANGYLLRLTDNNLDFDQMIATNLNLQAGVWYHVAAVNSNGTRRLYLNGLEQALTSTGTYTVQANADPLCLGVDYLSYPGRFFSGQMDEVRIWNVARSEAEIQANLNQPLAGTEPGLVAYWRFDEEPLPPPSDGIRVAAGRCHSLVLQADGSVAAFGDNRYQQCVVPAGAANAVAVAAGDWHSLALRANATVVGWGDNTYGQTNIPATATDVVAIDAGGSHSLALKRNGTVVGWGRNNHGQTNVPAFLDNVVAIAAGGSHSLALKADGTVVGWGNNTHGQTNATGLNSVVAIAAGADHSLALLANGEVVAWGLGNMGQTSVPPEAQSGVVAIAAGQFHNLALKQDGTVASWGGQGVSLFTVPAELSNVVAIAAGGWHSLFLTATPMPATITAPAASFRVNSCAISNGVVRLGWESAAGHRYRVQYNDNVNTANWTDLPLVTATGLTATTTHDVGGSAQRFYRVLRMDPLSESFVSAQIPSRVGELLRGANGSVITNLNAVGSLRTAAEELSGAKALMTAVLELGLPYTMERDDVLHGFLYGSESLTDLEVAQGLFTSEMAKLQATPDARPLVLEEVVEPRFLRFAERLEERLNDLAARGQPEIPRLVGHTLRLLNLLRDAWPTVPPPALEIWRETNTVRLVLYGEPYARHALQSCTTLTAPAWYTITSTNLHNEERVALPLPGSPQRFYRAVLPPAP